MPVVRLWYKLEIIRCTRTLKKAKRNLFVGSNETVLFVYYDFTCCTGNEKKTRFLTTAFANSATNSSNAFRLYSDRLITHA